MESDMPAIKMTATYDEDARQNIVLVGMLDEKSHLDENLEYFGCVTNWDGNIYARYPFTMEQLDNEQGVLEWGAWDQVTKTVIDIFQRRIVPNEKILSNDEGNRSVYTVTDVVPIT
jgi:hypothetical protein